MYIDQHLFGSLNPCIVRLYSRLAITIYVYFPAWQESIERMEYTRK